MNHHHHHYQPLHKLASPPPFGGCDDSNHMLDQSSSKLNFTTLTSFLNNNNNNVLQWEPLAVRVSDSLGHFEGYQQQVGATFASPTGPVDDVFSFLLTKHDHPQDVLNEFGGLGETCQWYHEQNITPPQSCASAIIDSQSSICEFGHAAGSPTSALKPKAGDVQGSGFGSSEDEDAEIEAGPCEQSNDPGQMKRKRRMDSNRESARRSRKRKQEYLQELETQVDQLTGESATLFKQLEDAAHQLRNAATNNRVLKSDVEALRAKVKLAEDRVTRGTISPTLNHILQTQLIPPPQILNPQATSRVGAVSPTIPILVHDEASQRGMLSGIVAPRNINDVSDHLLNVNAESGLVGSTTDAVSSCVSEIWS